MNDKNFELLMHKLENDSANWTEGRYTFDYKGGEVQIWTTNGFWFLHICKPDKIKFNILQKLELSIAIWNCKNNKLSQILAAS